MFLSVRHSPESLNELIEVAFLCSDSRFVERRTHALRGQH
jgi:hypothetical protein